MKIYLIDYENVNEQGLKGVKSLEACDMVYIFYSDHIKSIPFERSMEMTQSKGKIDYLLIKKTGKNYLDFQLTTYLGYLICKHEGASFFIVSKDTGFDSTVDFWKGRNVKIARTECIQEDGSEKAAAPVKTKEVKKSGAKKGTGRKKAVKKEKEVVAVTEKETAEPEAQAVTPVVLKAAPAEEMPKKKSKPKQIEKPALPESFRKKVRIAVEGEGLAPNQYTTIYKGIVESNDKVQLNNTLVKQFESAKGGVIYGKVKAIYEEFQKGNKK